MANRETNNQQQSGSYRHFRYCFRGDVLSRLQVGKLLILLFPLLIGCSSVDCPLNNSVYVKYKLVGSVAKLPEKLSISTKKTDGNDSVLINQLENAAEFSLPVSYIQDTDILYFQVGNSTDTVWMDKTNEPHFESVDCGVNYFHTITNIRHTNHTIDSIVINRNKINYDISEDHIHLYFKEYRF